MLDTLLNFIESQGLSEFDVPWDFYWFIEKESLYNPYVTPSNPTLGQLSSDLDDLQAILRGESPPVGYALVWFSAIIRAVGESAEV